ncbi:MAG: DNA mismatch repair endonuclease MutL [Halovenus sp.]
MTPPEIHRLDAQTVERIAAGEVVERPASAVKELVENSIDADASRVTVAVSAGGTEGIRVTDDGVGMSRGAVERAVDEHTTSKITDIGDLEAGVGTLGFRGEALHAIGAVSRLTITTRPRGGDRGTRLTVEGGEVTDVSPAGCPEGTTVEVADLFYNVPARRKYLKQEATEFAHVNTVVTSYALANPDVAVTLEHDGRETFATTGQGDLRETVLSVYGREVAQAMVPVEETDLTEGPLSGVSGLVSHPETNRASRDYLTTFVNGRYVTAGSVREAVVEAYGTQLAADRYPFAVLFLDVDPAAVDVNVHPRKLEIRFADEAGVREQVSTAVETALFEEGLLRSSAPRGRSAPDQTELSPGDSQEGGQEPTAGSRDGTASAGDKGRGDPPDTTGHGSEPQDDANAGEGTAGAGGADTDRNAAADGSAARSREPDRHGDGAVDGSGAADDVGSAGEHKFGGVTTQERLGAGADSEVSFERLPPMRVLGQLYDTYVVAESDDGLVLIDQHAADERVNYERLRERFRGDTTTQSLAQPVELEITAREADLFDAHTDALASLGFHARRIDDRTVEVRTVPALIADSAEPELLRDVLGDFVVADRRAGETIEAVADTLLADLACYPSITGNTSLTEGSIVDLLAALDDCENPYACPHGRPVIVAFGRDDIEARFERDYPGHG